MKVRMSLSPALPNPLITSILLEPMMKATTVIWMSMVQNSVSMAHLIMLTVIAYQMVKITVSTTIIQVKQTLAPHKAMA